MEGVSEDLIQRFYGVHGPVHRNPPPPPSVNISQDASGPILDDNELPYHEAVEVPDSPSPFGTEARNQQFEHALATILAEEGLPSDVDERWIWDPVEELKIGRGTKLTRLELPEEVWKLRVITWAKARDVLAWMIDH